MYFAEPLRKPINVIMYAEFDNIVEINAQRLYMMNTHQMRAILQSDYMTKHFFQGVFPVDQLPLSCEGMYVINAEET